VAVKVMATTLAASGSARQRFIREARAAAAVSHEHIIDIHEVQPEGQVPYIVMEYVAGMSLDDKLKRTGALALKELLRIGYQVACGLSAAHKQGLIHRDIKPANILLENGVEKVKITDFGLARVADDASVTQSGIIAGTPQYMSPEQAEGHPLDARSDLFSLGSVLYAMCTGRPPFRASGTMAVLKRVCEQTPRPIREVNLEIPQALCDVIDKLHAKNPAERYQSATEVAELLEGFLANADQLQQASGVASAPRALTPATAAPQQTRGANATPLARKRRWPRRVGITGLVLLALVLIAIWGDLVTKTKQLFYHELVVQLPDAGTVVEFWETSDTELRGTRMSFSGAWPMEPRATITNRQEKSVRLPPGNYYVFASKDGKSVDRRLIKIGWGGKQVLRIGDKGTTAPETGWVQLFNGKDLSGWKTHPDEPGDWKVENGVLIGSGPPGNLFSERGDYGNFHVRLEAKISPNGDSGLFFRAPFKVLRSRLPYEAQILGKRDLSFNTGSLWGFPGGEVTQPLVKPDEWFTEEVIARDNHIVIRVNGQTTVDFAEPSREFARGHLALQHLEPAGIVQFRKIEIRELPARPPEVPQRAADVLPFLAGSWKAEALVLESPRGPTEAPVFGHHTYDFIANGKFLRGRAELGNGTYENVQVYSHDARTGDLRLWLASNMVGATGPAAGVFDADKRTLQWLETLPGGNLSFHHLDFVDSDTIESKLHRTDSNNKITFKMHMKLTRLKTPVLVRGLPPDPKRPDEMKVLDKLVGEWRNDIRVKNAAIPVQERTEFAQVKAESILGGHFVEMSETIEANNSDDYSLIWFDAAMRQYRQWTFLGSGRSFELRGSWDEATKTLTWQESNNAREGRWVFKSDDLREFHHIGRGAGGSIVFEATGVSRRIESAGFVPLFNGKDLSGWTTNTPKNWRVADGLLIGDVRNVVGSNLSTSRADFQDCHVRCETKITAGTVFFWVHGGDGRTGHRVELKADPTKSSRPAAPDGKLLARELVAPDTWHLLEIVAKGTEFTVLLDGNQIVQTNRPALTKGAVMLTLHGANTIAQFRKIEIKELPPSVPQAALDGRWVAVGAEYQGQPVPQEEARDMFPSEMLIKGDQYGITWAGKQHEGGLRIDPTKMPAEIDFTGSVFAGLKPRKAIYELDGNRLRLCLPFVGPNADPPRPASFTTDPQSKNAVLTYVRSNP
jgi:uncharacterized protein (TIGR03067 family)